MWQTFLGCQFFAKLDDDLKVLFSNHYVKLVGDPVLPSTTFENKYREDDSCQREIGCIVHDSIARPKDREICKRC